MMKYQKLWLVLTLTVGLSPVIINAQRVKINYAIVDQQGGKKGKAPKWLFAPTSKLDKMYPDKMAFVVKGRGSDLDFVEMWAKRVDAPTEVANFISQQINDKLAAAVGGGRDAAMDKAIESITTSMAKAKITGLRKEDQWWVLKQYNNGPTKGEQEYEYNVLFLINKDTMDSIIKNIAKEAVKNEPSRIQARAIEELNKLSFDTTEDQ